VIKPVTYLFSFLSINSDSESFARQSGKVMGIRRLEEVSLINQVNRAMTHAPPPCRVDVPTLKTITWHPSDLFFKSANKPLSWLWIWTGESVVSQTRTERTHQRVHVSEQDFKIVDRALQNLALVHVRQDTGKTLKRNSPLALQIGVSVLGVLTDKDTDTGREKTDLVVLVRVNEVLGMASADVK
jgi:hypothetical protein